MFFRACLRQPKINSGLSEWKDLSTESAFVFEHENAQVYLVRRNIYPTTFAFLTDSVLEIGYGPSNDSRYPNEYLKIRIDAKRISIEIHTDYLRTLPIFIGYNSSEFVASDIFEEVFTNLAKKYVDKIALARFLTRPETTGDTLIENIKLISEEGTTSWDGRISRSPINRKIEEEPSDLSPLHFPKLLEDTLQNSLGAFITSNIAFEASGGLDSSMAPFWYAKTYNLKPVLGSMLFPGDFGRTQLRKLKDLSEATEAELLTIVIDQTGDIPLRQFVEGARRPGYQYEEIYSSSLDHLASILELTNTDFVYTGVGGDELFENINESQLSAEIPAWINRRTLNFLDTRKPSGKNYSPLHSAIQAGLSRNNIYIRHGIWPLSPLINPVLYNYCQKLPIECRINKNILRAYQQTHNYPKSIYFKSENEHFGDFFEKSMAGYLPNLIKKLMEDSRLAKAGWLNPKKLEEPLLSIIPNGDWIFDLFRLAFAELFLQNYDLNL